MTDLLKGYESFRAVAKRIKRDPSRLRQLRIEGRLPEAIKVGRDWYLPKGVKVPLDNGSR